MSIDQLILTLKPELASMLGGQIDTVNASIRGGLDANLMKTLSGNILFNISNGSLKGFNIGGQVLHTAKNIPLMSGSLYDKLGGEKKQLFDVADTDFKTLKGNLTIGNGVISIKDALLVNPAYDLKAEGKMGIDMNLDLNANINFTPEISQLLVGSIKELKGVLDAEGRLLMPLTLRGVPPQIIVIPNLEKLLEMGAKSLLKSKAGELLDQKLSEKTGIKLKGLTDALGF